MTKEIFERFVFEELLDYVQSPEFKARCADVVERQTAGEDIDVPAIAQALRVPIRFANYAMTRFANEMMGRMRSLKPPGSQTNGSRPHHKTHQANVRLAIQ